MQEDILQPKAILVDDYVDAKARPEPSVRESPSIIPSTKYYILQQPSIVRDRKPYSGREGYTGVPEDIPALVPEFSDDDEVDNSSWSYGGPKARELKNIKYPFPAKEDSNVVIAYGEHHLINGDRMYPLNCLTREPTQYPPQRVMEEWAMNCSALQYTADPLEC